MGRIFDDRGNRMTPSTVKRGSIRYRYYVSCLLAQPQERGRNHCPGLRHDKHGIARQEHPGVSAP
jgi:hypothetical protein